MVQLLIDPTLSPCAASPHETADGPLVKRPSLGRTESTTLFSRDEHLRRMRDVNIKKGLMKAPRRGWSMTDYQASNDFLHSSSHGTSSHIERQAPIPENDTLEAPIDTTLATTPEVQEPEEPVQKEAAPAPRPKLPPPRRSYSVMDYEPPTPGIPMPAKDFTLLDLPSELHYTIFDFLDPIDSVCLGLTNSNLYDIHRRMHWTVPLSSRYEGPNDMEWAWRGAGPLVHRQERAPPKAGTDIDQMRVKGQVYCRKCGISRCELHRHLKDWMGHGYEYCPIRDMYVKPAGEDAKRYCYMKTPKNPNRCGRHGGKKMPKADQTESCFNSSQLPFGLENVSTPALTVS
ncbi:hypothetical protein G7046_g8177 [Stylonectria norvegica]|nr:hypothetical protein G7046_g8177 [Stylonectria norvegica]